VKEALQKHAKAIETERRESERVQASREGAEGRRARLDSLRELLERGDDVRDGTRHLMSRDDATRRRMGIRGLVRDVIEAERDVERLKEQQRLADLEAQKQQRQAAIAKAALEREFQRDLPQIRSLLRPLITDGLTQPGRNNFEPADKKGPVSLAKLRGTGALAPTAKARAGLYYIVGSNNDRDLGSFPRYRGGAQDVQSRQSTMMRVQELVNKYGELMVEKGMLAE